MGFNFLFFFKYKTNSEKKGEKNKIKIIYCGFLKKTLIYQYFNYRQGQTL